MTWFRRIALSVGVSAAIGVILLNWQLVAQVERFSREPQQLGDLRVLALLLFGLVALYTALILMSPFLGAMILSRQSESAAEAVIVQLREVSGELQALREQTSRLVLTGPRTPNALAQQGLSGREYLQLSRRIRYFSTEIAQAHRSLGALFASRDLATARWHFHQALEMAADPATTADVHYAFACALARHGAYPEATEELESAFTTAEYDTAAKLSKDIQPGGQLYQFAGAPPFDAAVNHMLMRVSLGA